MDKILKLKNQIEKTLKVETQEESMTKIKKTIKTALEILLSDTKLENGEELTKISIKEHSIQLYTGDSWNPQPYPIVENQSMDRDSLENFIGQYPRLRIINPVQQTREKIDVIIEEINKIQKEINQLERDLKKELDEEERGKIHEHIQEFKGIQLKKKESLERFLKLEAKVIEENNLPSIGRKYYLAEVVKQSDSVDVIKNVIYIDKSLESESDERVESEKMADFQVEGNTDFAIHQMIKHGYTEGMLTELDKSAYGYDEITGNYVKLGTNEYSGRFSKKRSLAFKKLNYPIKENKLPRSNVIFIETRVSEEISPDRDLIRIFNSNKKGIIILDKLLASDLLRSEAFKEGEIKTVHNMGVGVSHDNPTLVVSNEGSDTPTEDTIRRLKAGKFAAIIDTSNKLNAKQVLELSQTQLVVLNWSLTRIESTFNSILLDLNNDVDLYSRFIDNIIYLGDFRGAEGEQLVDTNRKLLKERKFSYFGEVVNRNNHLINLLRYLHLRDVKEIGVKNNAAYVIRQNKKLTPSVRGRELKIDDDNIINLLWKVIATGQPEEMIEELEREKIYSLIFEMSTLESLDSEVRELIRVTIYNTGRNLNLLARRLPEPLFNEELVKNESRIVEFTNSDRIINTRLIKAYLEENYKDKRFLIVDEMYVFDVLEYKDKEVDQIIVLRSLDTISRNLIRNFNPDIIVYNAEYNSEYIAELIKSVSRDAKLLFTGEYPLREYLSSELGTSYEDKEVLAIVEEFSEIIDGYELIMGKNEEESNVLEDITVEGEEPIIDNRRESSERDTHVIDDSWMIDNENTSESIKEMAWNENEEDVSLNPFDIDMDEDEFSFQDIEFKAKAKISDEELKDINRKGGN